MVVFGPATGFSWPADAMGSCCSCLYRDPIRDNHLTKFKVGYKITAASSYHVQVVFVVACLPPCLRSLMWMMRATSWALGSWSSRKRNLFFTHERGTTSGGHISACDATATTPTCSLLRAAVAVRRGRVSFVKGSIFSCSHNRSYSVTY